jgi:beta-mannosidase
MESKNVDGKWLVELSTDKPAFGVWVNASGIKGEFDDNHFTLLPSEPRTIEFKPQDAATKFDDFAKSLSVKHIRQTY